MYEEVELFVPHPGSVAWRVLTHLTAKPEDILMRKDVARLTGCQLNSVDAMLQKAVARQCLMMFRNSALEVTWRLGNKKNFRLDKLDESAPPAPPPAAAPAPVPAPAPAPAPESYRAIAPTTETPPQAEPPRVKRAYTRRTPAASAEQPKAPGPVDAQKSPTVEELLVQKPGPLIWVEGPRMVSMPFQLTPELIEAVKTDPSTSFEDKADGHHAIGWLIDAWAVLVRKANANRGPSISPREAGYVDLTSVTVLGALLLIVLGSIGLMVYGIEANKAEWEKFKVDNNCKVTSKVSGDLFNTVGFDAKGGVVVGVGATPDKTGWLCSDGVTYFR